MAIIFFNFIYINFADGRKREACKGHVCSCKGTSACYSFYGFVIPIFSFRVAEFCFFASYNSAPSIINILCILASFL